MHYIGMDATLFLRFTRMCRNMFLVLSVLYCLVLIPINSTFSQNRTDADTWLDRISCLHVFGQHQWGLVVVAWASNLIICGFLLWNYRKIVWLRREYFESEAYKNSLHSRTVIVTDVPKRHCSDEGLAAIIDQVAPEASFSRTTIARNMKHLPALINEYEEAVEKLEKLLAKYLKDPENLPRSRPMCSPLRKDRDFDRGAKVDAIDYWNRRVYRLRMQVFEARKAVDKRNAYPYGFASFPDIAEAHAVAYASRKKRPAGSTIKLAPKPTDLIWENLHLNPPARRFRRLIVNLWVLLLTVLWIAPNAMMAIFLVNLGNLGRLWPAFGRELARNPTFWSIVQGVANPAITSAIYLILPIIFRRLAIRAGDQSKTGRERHVMSKLYSFFVFNNLLVFSLFSSIWGFVVGILNDARDGRDIWRSFVEQKLDHSIFISLCRISPFWITWLLQRQLAAAIDLSQLWNLLKSFVIRRVSHPTPRDLINLTAPPPFQYAMYYNYFLFYSTVSLFFGGLQPIVLPAVALYFCLDVGLKKYLLLYVFVTKTESGGLFWRPLFNRFIFGVAISNCVVFLAVWVRGVVPHVQAFAVIPLPFIMIGFKFLCSYLYDDKLYYYSTTGGVRRQPRDGLSRNDRLSARFGHPVLYKELFKPMVHKKAEYKLSEVLNTHPEDETSGYVGYSDSVVKMEHMMAGKPGKSDDSGTLRNFELVAETRLDFEHYKNRAEFAEDHGGGEIFERSGDMMRPGTPGSTQTSEFRSRPGTPPVGRGVPAARSFSQTRTGRAYPSAAAGPSTFSPYGSGSGLGSGNPQSEPSTAPPDSVRSPLYSMQNDSQGSLIGNSASTAPPGSSTSSPVRGRVGLGAGHRGYGPVPQADEATEQNQTSYDYFRGPRTRTNP